MAPEEHMRHRRRHNRDGSSVEDEDLHMVVESSSRPSTPEPEPEQEQDCDYDSDPEPGPYDILKDPYLKGLCQDFLGDIKVLRVRPALQYPYHRSPVQAPHRIETLFTAENPSKTTMWGRLPKSDLAQEAVHECLATICGAVLPPPQASSSQIRQRGVVVHQYAFNDAKAAMTLRNEDGALAFLPQSGPIGLDTELGWIDVRVGEIGVVPAGLHFSMSRTNLADHKDAIDGYAGYVLEVLGGTFVPLGPLLPVYPYLAERVIVEQRSREDGEWTCVIKDSGTPLRPFTMGIGPISHVQSCVSPNRQLLLSPPPLPPGPPPPGPSGPPGPPPPPPPPSSLNASTRLIQNSFQAAVPKERADCENGPLRTAPISFYVQAHGPMDVVAWQPHSTDCSGLPYKVSLTPPLSRPEQSLEPCPVLEADLGGGEVARLLVFGSSGMQKSHDDGGGLNRVYGVLRGVKHGDAVQQGLEPGGLIVEPAGCEPGLAPQCETWDAGVLGFELDFPGDVGFTEWAMSRHPNIMCGHVQ